ncbi:SDR family NAD(P)-dependent oxidoreductase [Nonomuraea sp. B10E15]|uniref:SDR family NAD(P)-dependent oxidoreductase n=1 Tax=Nonomuraea sp. B10E15 TaxID=3153560 RepID=UPI00325C59DC
MDSSLRDKVVVVAGAGTGIGRATARLFTRQGAQVVAVGRRAEPLAEAAAGNDGIHPLTADIAAEGAAEEIVCAVMESHGRLDVLVNNAGIVGGGTLGTFTRDLVEPPLATNLVAPVMLAQAALPALEVGGGVIVNVTTSVGQRGHPGST